MTDHTTTPRDGVEGQTAPDYEERRVAELEREVKELRTALRVVIGVATCGLGEYENGDDGPRLLGTFDAALTAEEERADADNARPVSTSPS